MIHFLQGEEAEFHTYQMQEDKAYSIVIRNLHPTTNTAEIRTALEEKSVFKYAKSQMSYIRLQN
ncbi:Hypothetical protein CINCED_3A009959 [Cinara cedri]|uniref:Uncharacterized protein n=1 Tax=Cinara cedri TaxID=506608 RepID=A0A5E4NNK5_9HEMI|nr:Hypothetical protein CINCED_3A009959 [Cinara cedri]